MKKMFQLLPRFLKKREVLVFMVLPIMVMVIPYIIIWLFFWVYDVYHPDCTHYFFYNVRFITLIGIIIVGLIGKAKIDLVEAGFTASRKTEKYFDICLTFFIWIAFAVFLILSIPALIVTYGVAEFASEAVLAQSMVDGIIYILAISSVFIFGITLEFYGEFPKGKYLIVFNHESSLDYFLWPAIIGWIKSKIVAGKNLLKFPVVGAFIKLKSIIIDRNDKSSCENTLREIKKHLNLGFRVALNPGQGRDRLSSNGVMRPFSRASFGIIGSDIPVVPVLVLGSGKYKPPMNGEPLAKKWWKFQWWNSPRKIRVIIMDSMSRLENETAEEFSKRVYDAMSERKKKELGNN